MIWTVKNLTEKKDHSSMMIIYTILFLKLILIEKVLYW